MAPELTSQCVELILKATKGTDRDISEFAKKTLMEIIRATPELAPQYLDQLLEKTADSNWHSVLKASMAALQVVPELAPRCLDLLLGASQYSKDSVRGEAEYYYVEIAQVVSSILPQCLEAFLKGSKDNHRDNREFALGVLGAISTRSLLESYWTTKNERLIPMLLRRFHQTPLMVADNYATISWYDTAGNRVLWEKDPEEMKQFIAVIRNKLSQTS